MAVITGASRGIGRAISVELAGRGHRVLATMRDPAVADALLEAAGSAADLIEVARLDVVDPGAFAFPAETDILVNNAGGMEHDLPFETTTLDEWRRVFEVNVFGTVELTRRVIPVMRARSGGVICNFSTAGTLQPSPWISAYRAAKAAVSSLDDSLRLELAPFGIRIVEILPALVETDAMYQSAVKRPPDAVRVEGYKAMASANAEGFAAMRDYITPPGQAAVRIVDALLEPSGPMRRACDPVGGAALRRWRQSSDEELYERFGTGNLS